MSSAGTVRRTGFPPETLLYAIEPHRERGPCGPLPLCLLGRARRTEDASRVAEAEAVALASLVPHVAGIEVTLETSLDGHTLEHLHAVGSVRLDEVRIRVGQEVVHAVALRHHPHVLHGVDVVIRSANAKR